MKGTIIIMKNIWMLARANLLKSKSRTVSMILIIVISVMLLNIGLVMNFRMGGFFDERAEELNAPHWVSFQIPEELVSRRYEFIRDLPYVEDVEYNSFIMASGTASIQDFTLTGFFLIAPYSETQRMNPPPRIGGDTVPAYSDIFLPYTMTLDRHITRGDEVQMTFAEEVFTFIFAETTEDILFDGGLGITRRLYVSEERFNNLRDQFPDSVSAMITVRLNDIEDISNLSNAVWDEFIDESYITFFGLSGMRSNRTMVPLIAAMLMVAFALIILVVGIIVTRFRIMNDIEENMVNIGVQKAMGFLNRQIILSISVQFSCIAFVGGVIGVLIAQIALPMVTGLVQPIFGLPWSPSFDIPFMAVSLGFALLMVALFSFITAQRIRKLHPLTALRGGISTHSFKRNPVALDKSIGSLPLLLALKNIFLSKKQAVIVGLIILAVSFSAVSGLAAHYNINVNPDAFFRTIVGEISDAMFWLDDPDDLADFSDAIAARPEVERVSAGGSTGMVTSLIIDGQPFTFAIVGDFSYFAGYELVDGRFPQHDNEIAIGANSLSAIGASIGDWITITGHDGESAEEFIITGSTQSSNHSGMICLDALARINIYAELSVVNVHLLAGEDIDGFIESVLIEYGDIISDFASTATLLDNQLGAMNAIFYAVTAVILTVVSAIVILVLYLVIKTTIIRRRRELGIQKAIGFTTFQLMNQIAMGLSPSIIIGTVLGSAGGYLGFNAIFVALVRGMGIARADLPIPLAWVAVMCTALVVLAYTISLLTAWRIRKISAYALVTRH